jgi:hypothetical protein
MVISKVKTPDSVGVPLSKPADDKDKPLGSDPDVIANVDEATLATKV